MLDYLDELNDQQRTAVTAEPGPILVLAGPGSGKTRVLTHRIVYLIRELRVAPWQIMAVTFTNKAAKEMSHRISDLLDGQPRGLTVGTFHATCARLLRTESDNLEGYTRGFVIFDTADQQQVVKQALKDLNLFGLYEPGPFGRGPLAHSDSRMGTVMFLAVPIGFSFSVVQVAANTFLNARVPLGMQGRVFALQGAVKNATAIIPLLALGGLASWVGVRPVLVIAPLLILFLALYGASKSSYLAGRQLGRSTAASANADGSQGREHGANPA